MKNAHPKVVAAGLAGAVVTLLNVVLHAAANYNPTPGEVGAEVTVVSYLAGYLKQG